MEDGLILFPILEGEIFLQYMVDSGLGINVRKAKEAF